MSVFSEESKLLIENWDTVEDILEAEKRLRAELASLLLSVESELAKHNWWGEGWVFRQTGEAQVYISNQNWQVGEAFAIWIGVENFNPTAIFGVAAPPTLYVWVQSKHTNLVPLLSERIEASPQESLGEIDTRSSSYVVRHAVGKYLSGEAEKFSQNARQQIVNFFAHYAKLLISFDSMIQAHLAGG